MARAFFLKGDDALARRHFERVLAGDPSPAMAANIRRFLRAIRDRRKWHRRWKTDGK
ncbi:MAG: hypothetical protein OXU96_04460 [Gammaproteobacteria bacterium]|nr:hypothetical protein [Gammaproteobacteria bacterium]